MFRGLGHSDLIALFFERERQHHVSVDTSSVGLPLEKGMSADGASVSPAVDAVTPV